MRIRLNSHRVQSFLLAILALLLLGGACSRQGPIRPTTPVDSFANTPMPEPTLHSLTPILATVTSSPKNREPTATNTPSSLSVSPEPSPLPATVTNPLLSIPTASPEPSSLPATVTDSFLLAPTARPLDPPGVPVVFYYAFDGHMYRTDVAGSFAERLTITPESDPRNEDLDPGFAFYRPPQVSPDGRWLLLNGGRGNWKLLDLAMGLEVGQGQGQPRLSPSWSPDSQRFAYLTYSQLCLYELSDQTVSCSFSLPQNSLRLIGAVWSPTGDHIAVAAATGVPDIPDGNPIYAAGEVWLIHVPDGRAKLIGTFSTGLHSTTSEIINWLPDGSGLIIKTTVEIPSTLFRFTDDDPILFQEPVIDVSPDGRYVLHSSGRITGIEGTELYTLPFSNVCEDEKFRLEDWAWSPNGEHLAYTILCPETGQNGKTKWLYVTNISQQVPLWYQQIPLYSIRLEQWTPDGDYLLLQNNPSGWPQDSSIWRLSADGTGSPETIVPQGILLGTVSQWD